MAHWVECDGCGHEQKFLKTSRRVFRCQNCQRRLSDQGEVLPFVGASPVDRFFIFAIGTFYIGLLLWVPAYFIGGFLQMPEQAMPIIAFGSSAVWQIFKDRKEVRKASDLRMIADVELAADRKKMQEKRRQLSADLRRLNAWKTLGPYDFEKEVARVLDACGAITSVTSKSRDGGIDIKMSFGGLRYAVQCKRFNNSQVGRPDCQALLGAVASEGSLRGVIVTTSRLSAPAAAFCATNGIAVISGAELVELHKNPSSDSLDGMLK